MTPLRQRMLNDMTVRGLAENTKKSYLTVNHLVSGGRVANMSIATDESYIDKNSGSREERTEWHRVVTFQPGLVDMLENHVDNDTPRYPLIRSNPQKVLF